MTSGISDHVEGSLCELQNFTEILPALIATTPSNGAKTPGRLCRSPYRHHTSSKPVSSIALDELAKLHGVSNAGGQSDGLGTPFRHLSRLRHAVLQSQRSMFFDTRLRVFVMVCRMRIASDQMSLSLSPADALYEIPPIAPYAKRGTTAMPNSKRVPYSFELSQNAIGMQTSKVDTSRASVLSENKKRVQVKCPLLLKMKGLNPESPLPTQTVIPGELMLGATRNVGSCVALNTFFKSLTGCHTRLSCHTLR